MARYIGEVQGGRDAVSRCGTVNSGLDTQARGWNLGVDVRLGQLVGDTDYARVTINGGSNSPGLNGYMIVHQQSPRRASPTIDFIHPDLIDCISDAAWESLFRDESFVAAVRRHLLPNLDKVQP